MSASFGRMTRKPLKRSVSTGGYTRLFFQHVRITMYSDRVVYDFTDEGVAHDFAREQGVSIHPDNLTRVVLGPVPA